MEGSSTNNAPGEADKALVQRFWQIFNEAEGVWDNNGRWNWVAGDFDSILDPNCVLRYAGNQFGEEEVRGRDGIKAFLSTIRTALPSFYVQVKDQPLAEYDKVVSTWRGGDRLPERIQRETILPFDVGEVTHSRTYRAGFYNIYVGIGVQFEDNQDEVLIAGLIEGSPAQKAGIKSGDVVVAADGESVRDEDISEVVQKFQGPAGSNVRLIVLRDGEECEFNLERAEINERLVHYTFLEVFGVCISRISDGTITEMRMDTCGRLVRPAEAGPIDWARRLLG